MKAVANCAWCGKQFYFSIPENAPPEELFDLVPEFCPECDKELGGGGLVNEECTAPGLLGSLYYTLYYTRTRYNNLNVT